MQHLDHRISFIVVLALAIATTSLVEATSTNRTKKTLCLLPIESDIQISSHAAFCTEYYANRFPQIEWGHKFLTTSALTVKNFVKNWVLQESACDFLVGPGYSYLAVGLSPLVEVAWIDPSATSTELSDKENHPTFSRVIPTDEVGAQAAVIVYQKFGWNQTNIFCSDESYGRSVSSGLSSALKDQGGSVDVSRCLEASATGERVKSALEAFLNSRTKVVFVAMLPFSPLFKSFKEEAAKLNATQDLVFFYSEAMCSASDRTYTTLTDGICATYLADPGTIDPFLAAYQARNITEDLTALVALGFPSTIDINNSSNIYAVLAHDAAYHAMSSIHAYHISGSRVDIFTYLRSHSTLGATGIITLDNNGDRGVVDGVVYNSQPGGKEKPIGTIKNQKFVYTDEALQLMQTRPDLYFFGKAVTAADDIPSTAKPETSSAVMSRDDVILGLSFGITIFVLIAVLIPVIFWMSQRGGTGRDVANAPVDESKPFAIVFTDIQSSTALWARVPVLMSAAVDEHHKIMRDQLQRCSGYEVKTIGDSFMCAFKKIEDAIRFGNLVEVELYKHDWNDEGEFEDTYQDFMSSNGGAGSTFKGNGIRVRIGCHYGLGTITLDEVTKAYDYYGTVVNTAARVEAVGSGGQFLISSDAFEALRAPCKKGLAFIDLGLQPLRGLETAVRLYQVDPEGVRGFDWNRKFPPLTISKATELDRLEVELERPMSQATTDGLADSTASHSGALEMFAARHTIRGAASGLEPRYSDRLLEFQQFARVFLSTSPRAYRETVVKNVSHKWGVPIGAGTRHANEIKNDLAYHVTLLDISAKVMSVVDAKRRDTSGILCQSRSASKFDANMWGGVGGRQHGKGSANVNGTASPESTQSQQEYPLDLQPTRLQLQRSSSSPMLLEEGDLDSLHPQSVSSHTSSPNNEQMQAESVNPLLADPMSN